MLSGPKVIRSILAAKAPQEQEARQGGFQTTPQTRVESYPPMGMRIESAGVLVAPDQECTFKLNHCRKAADDRRSE
jgi:hypothetical protein